MLPFAYVAGAALYAGAMYWLNRRRAIARWRVLRPVAQSAGITHLDEVRGLGHVTRLLGWHGTLQVEMVDPETEEKDVRLPGTVGITIQGLHPGLILRGPIDGGAAAGDTTIGDDAFDQVIQVHGPDAVVHALLDVETRARVLRLLARPEWPVRRCEVAGGELRLWIADPPAKGTHRGFVGSLRLALATAQRLVPPEDIPARLSSKVRADPQAGVRLRSLQALLRAFPGHPVTHEALSAARADQTDEVRLEAGLALGPAGLDRVREIAQAEGTDDACAARAVVALGPELTATGVLERLGHALRRRRLRTAEACLAWLGGYGGAEALGALAKVLAVEQGELAVASAGALGVTGLPGAEAPLVRALENANRDVRLAAAEALEGLGTASAILPLKAVAGDPALERAARRAIAAIQARLTGTPGELSLAGDEEGQLTLAEEDAAGRLSLAPPRAPAADVEDPSGSRR
jgi:HEAT repeat protein